MLIDKKEMIRFFVGLGISAVVFFIYAMFLSRGHSNQGFAAIIILVWAIIYLKNICGFKFLSFQIVFTLLIWLFHFGFFPLYYWGRENDIMANGLYLFSTDAINQALYAGNLMFLSLILGFTFSSNNIEDYIENRDNESYIPPAVLQMFRIVFYVCLIPFMINIIISLMARGYEDVYSRYTSGITAYLYLILYATSIFLFQNSINENRIDKVCLLYLLYAVSMLSGQRIDALCIILTFLLMQFGQRKFKLKTIALCILIVFVGLYFTHTIGFYRKNFGLMFNKLFSAENFIKYLSNPIAPILGEFGGTISTLVGSVEYYTAENLLKGNTYFASLVYIIPKLNSILPQRYITFIDVFPTAIKHGLGGSFLGEVYANFSVYGFIAVFIMSIFIGKITISSYGNNENPYRKWWKNVMIFVFFLLVRGYFKNVIFLGFWCWIIMKRLTKCYVVV